MKFSVEKTEVVEMLAKIQGITGRKSNLAITENLLIQSIEGGISISATDLETGFEGNYTAEVETEGIIAVNSKKIFEIIRNFPSNTIYIQEVENRRLKIGNQKVEYNLVGMNPDDFPEIPKIDDVEYFEIPSEHLKDMIEKTVVVSGASDEKRAHILGIYFECRPSDKETVIRMVATDGKRLSKADYVDTSERKFPTMDPILIPKKGLSEVAKFLEDVGDVRFGMKNNQFILKKENESIIINLLEGDFPEYEDIIRFDQRNIIALNKQDFKMMLKRMSILTSEEYKGVFFMFKEDTLYLSTANPEVGESKEDMVIEYKNEPVEVAYNPHFFLDALNFIDSEKVFLHFDDASSPCMVKGDDDSTYLSFIMPMKI